jgi:hypothetical protein
VSPVRYELGFISQKTAFFIVIAVKTSYLTDENCVYCEQLCNQATVLEPLLGNSCVIHFLDKERARYNGRFVCAVVPGLDFG